MPTLTPKLGIKKPLGSETVSRAAFNENYDIIDQNAAAQSDLDAHKNNLSNPHQVTPGQIGAATAGHAHPDATTSASGFMSAADKTKLNGIASGAEVNQNAFSYVKAVDASGASKGQADADLKTDLLTLKEGPGIKLTVDSVTDTITITAVYAP